jgi:hypothetical protein
MTDALYTQETANSSCPVSVSTVDREELALSDTSRCTVLPDFP